MLTIFTHTKVFQGHVGAIQRNAISQWTRLCPRPEILLFGNQAGAAEIAQELGLRHVPEVICSEFGAPLLSDLFEKAHRLASHNTLCYVNADIMLLGDFMRAVQQVITWRDHFLMVGQRREVELDEPAIYESANQEARLWALVLRQNRRISVRGIDYFVFPRGLFPNFPPFAIGRPWWDNWFLWKARSSNIALVDASDLVLAVHQNHGYSHHPLGFQGIMWGEDGRQNSKLAGHGFCTLEDATHRVTTNGITYSFRHLLARTRRTLRSWWWAFLRVTAPVRHPIGLSQERIAGLLARIGLLWGR